METRITITIERKIWFLAMGVLCLAAFSSLSLIWLRQQNTLQFREIVKLEQEIKQMDRKLVAKNRTIAELHRPAFLTEYLDKRFRAPLADQIVMLPRAFSPETDEALVRNDADRSRSTTNLISIPFATN